MISVWGSFDLISLQESQTEMSHRQLIFRELSELGMNNPVVSMEMAIEAMRLCSPEQAGEEGASRAEASSMP